MSLPNLPFYSQSQPSEVFAFNTGRSISPNRGYFRIKLTDMRLGRNFVGTKLLIPTLHAFAAKEPIIKDGIEVILTSSSPGSSEGGDLRTTYIAPTVLTPILPYDGNSLELQLGLFSLPFKDLAKELLELLALLASPLPYPQIGVAIGLTAAVRRGIDSLFGLNETKHLLSWKGSIGDQDHLSQQYLVVVSGAAGLDKKELSIVEGKLLRNAESVKHENYLVFAIQVAHKRPDWHTLPEVRPHFLAWNNARSTYGIPSQAYNNYVSDLLRALRQSPQIVPYDAERIAQEEILPLMTSGDEVQQSLFRAAGFEELPRRKNPREDLIDSFGDVDTSGNIS